MQEIRVGIIGATGYTALETARLVMSHPSAKVVAATSRADAGKSLAEVHPSLAGRLEIGIEELDAKRLANKCDVAMCCLPHGASAETVRLCVDNGLRVIDFSADFRLSNVPLYERWYGVAHPWPERVGNTAYGMPEFFRDQIVSADIVANPGCNSSTAILPLAPIVKSELIDPNDIIIDSKCGVSGAGRTPKLTTLYCEANESVAPYSVGSHRHQPEIDDLLHRITGNPTRVLFVPHLTPLDRGILSTIYVRPKSGVDARAVMDCWRDAFADAKFMIPVTHLPSTKHVVGTNFVQMTAIDCQDRITLVCAVDNLAKGASGAAIQNMNVMFGIEETAGLV